MLGKHLFRGLQQQQHVAAAAGHDGDFQKICAQFLHAAQAADQFVFERCFFKIVIGEHYADAGAVGGSHQVRNTVSAGKKFHVDQVCLTGREHCFVQRDIVWGGQRMRATFPVCAESSQQRHFPQAAAQISEAGLYGGAVFHLGKAIHAPFCQIGAQPGQRSGLSNQVLPGSAGKGHGDFRASCTDFQAAHVYGVHKSTPFCSYMVSVYLTAKRRFWQAVPIRAPLRLWGET